jgi:hypothetical protein
MNTRQLKQMLEEMWISYLALNPDAQKIHQLLSDQNPHVVNDHIALRTFNIDQVNLGHMARPFINAGYHSAGEYHFPNKHLYAQHFEHNDPNLPKIFISQLLVESLNKANRALINNLIQQIPTDNLQTKNFSYSGRHWSLSYTQYQQLLNQSEYAAWVAAFGYRPNHFTVLINALHSHHQVETLNHYLKQQGFLLNSAGGEVKGSSEAYLEQSSTLANKVDISFDDQRANIPGCYYEFARRYPLAEGGLYQGFVAASADKIFESTNTR